MFPAVKNSKATGALVVALRDRAVRLPASASESATLLFKYASEIELASSTNEALKNFNAFATHHKGLRDLLVPGLTADEWVSFVDRVRGLSKAAMRTQGLDRTLLGRVLSLVSGRSTE
jgi:hypothetical protein